MKILELAFATLHLFPAPGMVNPITLPDVIRQIEATQYETVARDKLRAINELRAKHGLPPLDKRGQLQGVTYE